MQELTLSVRAVVSIEHCTTVCAGRPGVLPHVEMGELFSCLGPASVHSSRMARLIAVVCFHHRAFTFRNRSGPLATRTAKGGPRPCGGVLEASRAPSQAARNL